MSKDLEMVKSENIKFYKITQAAYVFGALGHLGAGFLFLWWLKVYEMVWFNFIFSVPAFVVSFIINRRGHHSLAFLLAFCELLFHQIACLYFLGWDSGFQYYLIYLAGLTFFNARWSNKVRVFSILVILASFTVLYLFFKTPELYQFPRFYYDIFYLTNGLSMLLAMALLINYFVQTADSAENDLKSANQDLSQKNVVIQETLTERNQAFERLDQERKKSEELAALLKRMFGRYLSTEVMNSLIEDPSSLELGGERRSVTIMMSDLRGFTALSERLEPEQVVQMLNAYFEVMVEVISKYNGTINEIIGDALLIIFGAPQEMSDRGQRAIACAIEMQNRMVEVNERNRAQGLPDLNMGIGLNETEVIVGNIGSATRSKYAAVGSGVNMTSRIESYTVGGQILISESVRQEVGEVLRIDAQRDVLPKGAETPLRIYEVGGIAGDFNLVLEKKEPAMSSLNQAIPVQYAVLDGKDVGKKGLQGSIAGLSKNCADVALGAPVEILTNLKMNLVDVDEKLSARDFYGKVTRASDDKSHIVHFTSVPPEVDSYFQALQKYAATGLS